MDLGAADQHAVEGEDEGRHAGGEAEQLPCVPGRARQRRDLHVSVAIACERAKQLGRRLTLGVEPVGLFPNLLRRQVPGGAPERRIGGVERRSPVGSERVYPDEGIGGQGPAGLLVLVHRLGRRPRAVGREPAG